MNILLVDDDEEIVKLLSRAIEGAQFKVTAVTSGNEALALLASGEFDLLLSDVMMAPPGGIELTKAVREKYPRTDVILLTGYPTVDTLIKALKLGAYDYLIKPLDLMLVKAALRRCGYKRDLEAKLAKTDGILRAVADRVALLKVGGDVAAKAAKELEGLVASPPPAAPEPAKK